MAITAGGAGATFWMIVAGLLGMSSKFVECTLGVKYRTISEDGVVHGGPMYYLSKGLEEKGFGGLGKFFAVFFALLFRAVRHTLVVFTLLKVLASSPTFALAPHSAFAATSTFDAGLFVSGGQAAFG